MHPNKVFRQGDDAALIAWASRIGFAHLLIAGLEQSGNAALADAMRGVGE